MIAGLIPAVLLLTLPVVGCAGTSDNADGGRASCVKPLRQASADSFIDIELAVAREYRRHFTNGYRLPSDAQVVEEIYALANARKTHPCASAETNRQARRYEQLLACDIEEHAGQDC